MEEAPEENRQFEQVLNRLDALMKRSQIGSAAAPVPQSPEPVESPPVSVADQAPAEIEPVDQVAIPVLTEVYEGDLGAMTVAAATAERQKLAAELVDELMPELCGVLERALDEELSRVREALLSRLQADVAAGLRQRLMK